MTLQLPRRPPFATTPGDDQVWWQQVCEAIEANEGLQEAVFDELEEQLLTTRAVVARLAIGFSYTVPTLAITAADVGANVTITIAAHDRYYGDGAIIEVDAGTITGKAFSTVYGIYYDDTTREDPSPSYQATTNLQVAQANYVEGRHYVGTITTPADGAGATQAGAPPAGSGYTANASAVVIT